MFKVMLIKEFQLVSRDKHALAALFIMPCVFILIMSLALKDVFNEQKAMISVAIIDNANNSISQQLIEDLENNVVINLEKLTTDNKNNIDQLGKQFLLIIPVLYGDETGVILQAKVASDVTQNILLLFKAQIMQIVMHQKMSDLNARQEKIAIKMGIGVPELIEFKQSSIINTQYAQLSDNQKPTSTQQSVPSWIVFGLFFVIIPMSTIFISERKQNTLMRLSAMNISTPVLFAGKNNPLFTY